MASAGEALILWSPLHRNSQRNSQPTGRKPLQNGIDPLY